MASANEVLKVKSSTPPKQFGYSLSQVIRVNRSNIIIQAVGAGAINQAMKGVVEANKLLACSGLQVAVLPSFCDITEGDKTITGMRFLVEVRG